MSGNLASVKVCSDYVYYNETFEFSKDSQEIEIAKKSKDIFLFTPIDWALLD